MSDSGPYRRTWRPILLALLLVSCGGGGGGGPTPNPDQPPFNGWQQRYTKDNLSAPSFTFPSDGSVEGGSHYVIEPPPQGMAVGKTLTMTFTLSGGGTLAPNDPSDTPPSPNDPSATISLMLWQRGDNLSCAGAYSQYRLFSGRAALVMGSTTTISIPLESPNWRGCYGNTSDPATFANMLNNLYAIGVTFGGGSFAGHGLYAKTGTVTFTLNSFIVQ